MKDSKTIRTFIAFPIPQAALIQIEQVQQSVQQFRWKKVRWVPIANIHLTLSFLGDINRNQQNDIVQAIFPIAETQAPFHLVTANLGVFPNARRPNIIWLGLRGDTQSLVNFQQEIQSALKPLGFKLEKRPFKAHLTLGRVKGAIPENELADMLCMEIPDCSLTCDRLVFYQSQLSPKGARYFVLHEWQLKDGAVTT